MKVMRGGGLGTFSTCRNIFSKCFAYVDNFFKYNPFSNFFLFQIIIFPIEKSLHKFFFQTFLVHDFYFCFPPFSLF